MNWLPAASGPSPRPRCAVGWPRTRSSRGSTGPGSRCETRTSRSRPHSTVSCRPITVVSDEAATGAAAGARPGRARRPGRAARRRTRGAVDARPGVPAAAGAEPGRRHRGAAPPRRRLPARRAARPDRLGSVGGPDLVRRGLAGWDARRGAGGGRLADTRDPADALLRDQLHVPVPVGQPGRGHAGGGPRCRRRPGNGGARQGTGRGRGRDRCAATLSPRPPPGRVERIAGPAVPGRGVGFGGATVPENPSAGAGPALRSGRCAVACGEPRPGFRNPGRTRARRPDTPAPVAVCPTRSAPTDPSPRWRPTWTGAPEPPAAAHPTPSCSSPSTPPAPPPSGSPRPRRSAPAARCCRGVPGPRRWLCGSRSRSGLLSRGFASGTCP